MLLLHMFFEALDLQAKGLLLHPAASAQLERLHEMRHGGGGSTGADLLEGSIAVWALELNIALVHYSRALCTSTTARSVHGWHTSSEQLQK